MSRIGEKEILASVMARESLTKSDISKELGLSFPTVSRAIDRFCALGFIKRCECGDKKSSYSLNIPVSHLLIYENDGSVESFLMSADGRFGTEASFSLNTSLSREDFLLSTITSLLPNRYGEVVFIAKDKKGSAFVEDMLIGVTLIGWEELERRYLLCSYKSEQVLSLNIEKEKNGYGVTSHFKTFDGGVSDKNSIFFSSLEEMNEKMQGYVNGFLNITSANTVEISFDRALLKLAEGIAESAAKDIPEINSVLFTNDKKPQRMARALLGDLNIEYAKKLLASSRDK